MTCTHDVGGEVRFREMRSECEVSWSQVCTPPAFLYFHYRACASDRNHFPLRCSSVSTTIRQYFSLMSLRGTGPRAPSVPPRQVPSTAEVQTCDRLPGRRLHTRPKVARHFIIVPLPSCLDPLLRGLRIGDGILRHRAASSALIC